MDNAGPVTADLLFELGTEELPPKALQTLSSALETEFMPNAELRLIDSIWGHRAGNPVFSPEDEAVLRAAVQELLCDA